MKKSRIINVLILSLFILFVFSFNRNQNNKTKDASLQWEEGYLDIHFIHTGGGNVSLILFPDGTSLLYDAGDSKKKGEHPSYPPYDNSDLSTGKRIAAYIKHFSPNDSLDYALISHFHHDHYGAVKADTPFSKNGAYQLTGITEVGDIIPIKTLIDRAYPNYNFPVDLRKKRNGKENESMINYLKFIIHHQKTSRMKVEQLSAGSNRQIALVHQPEKTKNFEVRNIKVNDLIWTGVNDQVARYPFDPPFVNDKGYFNENPLSLGIKINYGEFDFYAGGDTPGVNDYPDYDMETSIANIIGEVDALTLDHHGYKDATNTYFLNRLKPQVIAHQSLHDPHFADNVQHNLKKSKADVFSLYMSDKVKKWYGRSVKKVYKSTKGHFFIRVHSNGEAFDVYVLDETKDDFVLKEKFGPYKSQ